jgi:hypothetical protein
MVVVELPLDGGIIVENMVSFPLSLVQAVCEESWQRAKVGQ